MKHKDAVKLMERAEMVGLTNIMLVFDKVANPGKKKPFDWDYDYWVTATTAEGQEVEYKSNEAFTKEHGNVWPGRGGARPGAGRKPLGKQEVKASFLPETLARIDEYQTSQELADRTTAIEHLVIAGLDSQSN